MMNSPNSYTAKWTVRQGENGEQRVCSSDFTHDVEMVVTGDFKDANQSFDYASKIAERLNSIPGPNSEVEWLEDELMECMRIVAPDMGGAMPDEITFAIMVTAIRRLMEADTERYEALLERVTKRRSATGERSTEGA